MKQLQLRSFLQSDQGTLLQGALMAGCAGFVILLPLLTSLLALVGGRLDGTCVCKYLSKSLAPETVSRTPCGTHCTRC
jgi:hypothetical protein